MSFPATARLRELLPRVREWGQRRAPWLLLLLALALGYYGSYYRHGLGFRDEGQTVAFGALRLLRGEKPLVDVFLGYNVLWFYPVVALFKLFGPSYVALRVWCFALSTLTAVLGFLLVEKTSRRPWFAFVIGALLVLLPGSTFKNYIPLLAIANTLCLVHHVLAAPGARRPLLCGAVTLGLSFLIRIDIALLFSALWLGVLALQMALVRERASFSCARRFAAFLGGICVLSGGVGVVHVPVILDAKARGFDRAFYEQYQEKWRMLSGPLRRLAIAPRRTAMPAAAAPARPAALPAGDKRTLQRATVGELTKRGQNSGADFLFLMYAPVASGLVLALAGLVAFARGTIRVERAEQLRGLAVLALIGGALTTFPQFFFFRPDIPHLSEFMPGLLASVGAAVPLLGARCAETALPFRAFPWIDFRRWSTFFGLFLLAHLSIYVWRVLPDRWAGTAAIRDKRTKFFSAENGVNVFVTSRELAGFTSIRSLISAHTGPDDYVVCYPYSPGINLLTNRRTYERNVYIDNNSRSTDWDAGAIARIERYQPAVIVLSDWDVNGTDASRFSVWAIETKTYIQSHYVNQGTYLEFEIFTRP